VNEENATAYNNATALNVKRHLAGDRSKSEVIGLSAVGKSNIGNHKHKIDDNTRVYFVGHGTPESTELGGLNAQDLADTIKTLVAGDPPKRIKRLGLVGCYTGGTNSNAATPPPHCLASVVFDKVKNWVDEVTGYAGEAAANWRVGEAAENTATVRRFAFNAAGGIAFDEPGKASQEEVEVTHGTGRKTRTRKVIVNHTGRTWAPDKD